MVSHGAAAFASPKPFSDLARRGRYGASLKVRGKSVLLLPLELLQSFFWPAISKCLHHVKEILQVQAAAAAASAAVRGPIDLHRRRGGIQAQSPAPHPFMPLSWPPAPQLESAPVCLGLDRGPRSLGLQCLEPT